MEFDTILLHTLWGLPCWLVWALFSLGSFLLGLLLGWWLWSKFKAMVDGLEKERDGLKAKITDMEKDYISLKYQYDEREKDNTALKASLNQCEADKAVLATKLDAAGSGDGEVLGVGDRGLGDDDAGSAHSYAGIFAEDNLQIIEGVGPKIEKLLKDAGFTTWAAVANADYEDLKKVLDDAGPRYRIHDPKSWSGQAKLAAEGKWDELVKYQKFLDTGRDDKGDFESPSKVEKLAVKILGFSSNPEDLKIVEGIGPKIDGLLKDAGINNWSDLAAASVDRLKEVLEAAGDRYRLADPTTWPKQAELAAAGKWKELSEYQDFLSGGKAPK